MVFIQNTKYREYTNIVANSREKQTHTHICGKENFPRFRIFPNAMKRSKNMYEWEGDPYSQNKQQALPFREYLKMKPRTIKTSKGAMLIFIIGDELIF